MLASARRRAWRKAGVYLSPPACGCLVGRAISPAAEPCGIAGVPGRCKHRPLRNRDKVLPDFTGYFRRQPAMHPSVCALRRIHRPVCGARIARRALKHACALRPLHLLRLAVSAAGGARLRSPLQGRLLGELLPGRRPFQVGLSGSSPHKAFPCKGALGELLSSAGAPRDSYPCFPRVRFSTASAVAGGFRLSGSSPRA